MFGRKRIAAMIGRMKYEIAVARASGLFMIRAARRMSVEVPRSAPRRNGIVFFRLMRREVASGTRRPMVIEDENTIPVMMTPSK